MQELISQELISPAQSELIVAIITLAAIMIGALWGWKTSGPRAAVFVALCALLIEPLWQMHKWLTRFDPQSGYFGLQSVKVLLMEVVAFVAIGIGVGITWNRVTKNSTTEDTENTEKIPLNNSL